MMKLFNRTKSAPEEMTLEERLYYYRHRGHVVPSKHILKTPEQIEGIRRSAAVNTAVLDMVAAHIREGISTGEIDRLVYDFTVSHGAIPAPLNYEGFPKSVCTSINEEVCHGIPDDDIVLQEGDIVNVDVSTILNGYYSDASRMFMIGSVRPACKRLVEVAKECLERGIAAAQPWGFLGDIGEAIQSHAEANGFSVVRDFCGHGVGLKFHEKPEVEHVGRKGSGMLLVPGMIFTIEPMINMGSYKVYVDSDNEWTVLTEDGKPSAQWENTILITPNGVEILTY
ncbi:MAG: type I methionyl aminopeptidase [Odoribacter sp.]|nr:type I methionyl aminopeptidase [Odoribacter sp.]